MLPGVVDRFVDLLFRRRAEDGEVRLASELSMRLTTQGGVEVFSANVEYGQGTNTVLAQIAAETCRLSLVESCARQVQCIQAA